MKNLLLFIIIISLTVCSTTLEKENGKELQKEEVDTQEISGKLDIPGTLFTYTAHGNGTPIITFIGGNKLGMNAYPDKLLKHVTLIHADAENISAEEATKITMDQILDDIDKVRIALDLDKISVLGHSMKGILPMEYALKYPDNLLFGISTGGLPFRNKEYYQAREDYWGSFASEGRKSIRKKSLEAWEAVDKENMTASEKFIGTYIANTAYYYYDSLFDQSGMWKEVVMNMYYGDHYWETVLPARDSYNTYHQVKSPILIISGKYDFVAPHFLWEGISDSIPKGEFHLFEKAGHNPMVEIPDEFTKVVVDWIESNR